MKKFKVATLETRNGEVTISKTKNGKIVKNGELPEPKKRVRRKTKIIIK